MSSLAADLVNTRPRPSDPVEKLTGADAVAALLEPHGLPAAPVDELRGLRDQLLRAFEAGDMGELAAALNPLLARGAALRLLPERAASPAAAVPARTASAADAAPARASSAAPAGWALRAPTDGLSAADLVAVAAATELATLASTRGVDRLGFCAADDCQAVFADTSPRGDRHYCSRRCSTRMNVRRFRKQ